MQLSLHTDYSLRVLLFLGANPGKRTRMAEIAGTYAISHEHLRKVIHLLAQLELIKTYRGKQGGIELAKTPENINIGDVVAASEPRKPVLNCEAQPCILAGSCSLQQALTRAEAAFYQTLAEYSLADLLKHKKMTALLAMEKP